MFIKIENAYVSIDDISRVQIFTKQKRVITENWYECRYVDRDGLHWKYGFDINEVTFSIALKSNPNVKYNTSLYFDSKTSSDRNLYDKDFSRIINYQRDIEGIKKLIEIVDENIKLEKFGRLI